MEPEDLLTVLLPSLPAFDARSVVAAMALRSEIPADRPRVAAVMIAAPDGRAAVQGRSGGLGRPADRDLLREARAQADAILVGTGTLRAERYGAVLDDDHRALRTAEGRDAEPRVVTICRDLSRLPVEEARIFSEPQARVTVFTASTEEDVPAPPTTAALEVVRQASQDLRPGAVLRHLRKHHGVELLVTEGGPTLLRELVAKGLLDDLILTVAPLLIGGDGPSLLAGDMLSEPVALRPVSVHRAGDHLFVHYQVLA